MELVEFASEEKAVDHMPWGNAANVKVNNLGEGVGWTNIERRNYGKKKCGMRGSICKVKHLSRGGETLKARRLQLQLSVLDFSLLKLSCDCSIMFPGPTCSF